MIYLEIGVYQLSTLCPIHIRAGEPELYGQGFIRLNDTDDFLYVVDTPKLQAEIFASKGLNALNTYTQAFSNPSSTTRIVDVLDEIGYDYKSNIEHISTGIVRLPSGNRFMLSGLGEYFIPGSSIKGAIKTAVLHNIIQTGTVNLDNFVNAQITEYLAIKDPNDQKDFKNEFADELLKDAFQSKHPQEYVLNPNRVKEQPGPFTDIFKAIKVKDATIKTTSVDQSQFAQTITTPGLEGATLRTLEGNEIQIPFRNIKNLTRGEWIKIESFEEQNGEQIVATYTKVDMPVQFEDILFTILQGNQVVEKDVEDNTRFECFHGETTIEISIDHEILDSFKRGGAQPPFSDLKSLIKLCQDFAQAQWVAEQQFLEKYGSSRSINLDEIKLFYADNKNKERATLRVGWGTGMLGTTISLLLDEKTRVKLRNDVISDDGKYRPQPAPKSDGSFWTRDYLHIRLDGFNLRRCNMPRRYYDNTTSC